MLRHPHMRTAQRTSTPNDVVRRDSGPHARRQQLQRCSSLGEPEPVCFPVRRRRPAQLMQLAPLQNQQRTASILPETHLEEPRAPLVRVRTRVSVLWLGLGLGLEVGLEVGQG